MSKAAPKIPALGGDLARWQDICELSEKLGELQRHVAGCSDCVLVYNLIAGRISLEAIARLPDSSTGWCVSGKEIYLKPFAAAAEAALKEML